MLSPSPAGVAVASSEGTLGRARRVPAEAWLVGGITVLAAVLRVLYIDSQSFWFDEAQAVHEVRSSFGSMWHLWSANEPNPPLYFLIAWPWARVFGSGEVGLRSLSAVCGTVTVPLLYLAGRELVSRRAGQVAALLAAVNPFLIWYSQEAREYMLLGALSAASLVYFGRARRTGASRDLAGWAVCGALTLGTAYFGGLLIAAEAIVLLVRRRGRGELLGCGLLVAVEAACVPHLLVHADNPTSWIADAGPLAVRARQVPVTLALNTMFKGPALSYSLLGAAIAAIVVIGLLLVGATDRQLRGAGVAAALAAVVLLVPLLLAVVGHDYYETRALIGGFMPLLVVIGAACAGPRARVAGAVAAAVLVAGFLYGDAVVQFGNPLYRRPDWKGVAAALGPATTTRAIVAFDSTFATPSLALYLPGVAWTGGAQDPQPNTDPAVTVSELDIVGSSYQSLHLTPGVRLIGRPRIVNGYKVVRLALATPDSGTPLDFEALASSLLQVSSPVSAMLVQTGSA